MASKTVLRTKLAFMERATSLQRIVADPLVNAGGTQAFTWLAAPTSWLGDRSLRVAIRQ
jgi:hypothetical protein